MRALICTLVFFSFILSSAHGQCPINCRCYTSGYLRPSDDVYCENVDFPVLLSNLSSTINKLVIRKSHIPAIATDQFTPYGFLELRELHLQDNNISDVRTGAFNGLPALKKLSLPENEITTLSRESFLSLSNLRVLNLQGNKLESVPDLSEASKLEVLLLSDNSITDLTCNAFSNLQNLKTMYIEDNMITALGACSFEGLHSLKELGMKQNNLATIEEDTFRATPNIETLVLSNNVISYINVSTFHPIQGQLKMLTLAGNALAEVPMALEGLISLKHLDLSENVLAMLPTNAFSTLGSLQELFIQDMATLEGINGGAFNGLQKLKTLSIEGNKKLTSFPVDAISSEDLADIEDIFINNNGIRTFSDELLRYFSTLKRLRSVLIHDNPIHCDCEAKQLQNVIASEISWASTWNKTNPPKCFSPLNLKGQAIGGIRPRDLTCDPPKVEIIGLDTVVVAAHAQFELSLFTWGGVPSTIWILPLGVSLHPKETKLGCTASEEILWDNTVRATITVQELNEDTLGPYTVVSTNANSGTATTFTVIMKTQEDEDVVSSVPDSNEVVVEMKADQTGGFLIRKENHNKVSGDALKGLIVINDKAISKENLPKEEEEQGNRRVIIILVFGACTMSIVIFSVLTIFKRKRKQDEKGSPELNQLVPLLSTENDFTKPNSGYGTDI